MAGFFRVRLRLLVLPAVLLAASGWTRAGAFDEEDGESNDAFSLRWSGLADLRYALTSANRSWRTDGPGKLRFGGRDIDNNGSGDRGAHVFALSQASLMLDATLPPAPGDIETKVHLQLNVDADSEAGTGTAGLFEAFATLNRGWERVALRLRLGAFVPMISLEHPGTAWSTEHTLTPSAIGSWLAEEVRTQGAEATAQIPAGRHSLKATAGTFAGSDQAGMILLYRGWGLHDYQHLLGQRLPVVNSRDGFPTRELDGRVGYYGRLDASLDGGLLRFSGGWWDNSGNVDGITTDASGLVLETWNTQFWDFGARLEWRGLTVLGQFMGGRSASPFCPRWPWSAWYGLASYSLGKWSVAGRFDRFEVNHRRFETGRALTGALNRELGSRQRLSLEYIYLFAPTGLGRGRLPQNDQLLQLNYRLRLG